MYVEFGGRGATPRLAAGRWDFALDGIVIELDEENHFNRYRALTLQSPIYDRLAGFEISRYRRYCHDYESYCLTRGGYWTSAPTEREFGASGDPGRLDYGPGSARWKQRAFYDFVKDLAPLTENLAVSRVSVWEEIRVGRDRRRVGDVLDEATRRDLAVTAWPRALLARVRDRACRERVTG